MSSTQSLNWYATCPKGVEGLLADELRQLGATDVRESIAGVEFAGPWATAYRACLWSRLANRVIWPQGQFDARDGQALYDSFRQTAWTQLFEASASIAVDFSGTNRSIRNSQFGAQRSKDAIVDSFVDAGLPRPNVDRSKPDIRIHVRLNRDRVQMGIDLSGGSLHQRGYRDRTGAAPLKENLAAAVLLRADWPGMAARGGALIDPMCGSGTLLIEGALMAAGIAPGLARHRFGFERLRAFDGVQWRALVADARSKEKQGLNATLPEMRGSDSNPHVIERAIQNIANAGLEKHVRVSCKPLLAWKKPTHKPIPTGLVVTNPPYGERMGSKNELIDLYSLLGQRMAEEFAGWQAAIFTAEPELAKAIGLRSHKRYALFNGTISTGLYLFDLANNNWRGPQREEQGAAAALTEGAKMFANRLRKNAKRLRPWLQREAIECYRLYDADMPEYAVAVDCYGEYVHVAEYKAPATVSAESAERRMAEVRAALPEALGVPASRIAFKERARQRGTSQYDKRSSRGDLLPVREGQATLLINLHDYLDTGLFLDHRPLRMRIAQESRDKDFLNLFCYTGTATVHAGLGGARSSLSVDASNTYLAWLRRNLEKNGLDETSHRTIKADCMNWLQRAEGRYDLILLDPPSFSNSKSVEHNFDVQRDQVELVRATMALLREDGILYFSNNRRGFKLDEAMLEAYQCEDITDKTLDPDFQRNRKIHCCWKLQHR